MSKPRGQYNHNIPTLMDESPISFYPRLACVLGVNEAIVLQQIWFYINVNRENESDKHHHEGKWWVYNSYKQWSKRFFPWLTPRGVQSIILHLEKLKILESTQGVEDKYDRRKWYTVNRAVLNTIVQNADDHSAESALSNDAENEPSSEQNLHGLNMQNLHEQKTENTTEKTIEDNQRILTASAVADAIYAPTNDNEASGLTIDLERETQISAQAEKVKRGKSAKKDITAPLTPVAPPPSPAPVAAGVSNARPPRKVNPMARLIDTMWNKGVSGGLLPMLMGNASPKRKEHHANNIEGGMTGAEIVGFARWYRSQNPNLNLPEVPYKVHDAVESFRNAVDYARWMQEGEKMLPVYQPKETPAAPVEQAPESTPEEIAAWKRSLVEQGLTEGFGDLFDDYVTEEHVS